MGPGTPLKPEDPAAYLKPKPCPPVIVSVRPNWMLRPLDKETLIRLLEKNASAAAKFVKDLLSTTLLFDENLERLRTIKSSSEGK